QREGPGLVEAYSDVDDDANPVFYSFGESSSSGNRDSHLSGLSLSDNESTVVPEDERDEPDSNSKERPPAAHHVLESEYAGDGYAEGHHSVKLTAVLSERATVPQSLFRWMEKDGLQNMIAGVKRDHAKTIQTADLKYVRYLEPKLRHEPLLQDGKPVGSQAVTWISLPYFCLEPYSGLLGANSSKSFPTPTLLQARYSRTARNRDMEQAVCQQKGAPKGLCFHIAQLWCLILDDSLLLTYGRITEEVLSEGIITKTVKPLPNSSDPTPSKTVSVRFRGTVMWSIPVHECDTWFSEVLAAHAPRNKDMAAQAGPSFVRPNLPESSGLTIPIVPNLGHKQKDLLSPVPVRDQTSPSPKPKDDVGPTSKSETGPSCGIFAYLECFADLDLHPSLSPPASLSSRSPPPPPSFKNISVVTYFSDIEQHIEAKAIPDDRRAYRTTVKAQRADVHEALDSERRSAETRNSPSEQEDIRKRVSVFNLADVVFNFFFPPDAWVPTTRKFWGALMTLVNVSCRQPLLFESDIITKPSDRRIEHKLGLLIQELSIIDWTVATQRQILGKMLATRESVARNAELRPTDEKGPVRYRHQRFEDERHRQIPQWSYGRGPRYNTMDFMAEAILESREPCGFSYLVLHESLKELAVKRSEVKLMCDMVANLVEANSNKINHTKDRQERAIYAFTIVTVIFLPLSAVASIFGMNSSDVRDMDLGQWAYWATAVPVTVLVMFLGLLFTGELGNVGRWVVEGVGRLRGVGMGGRRHPHHLDGGWGSREAGRREVEIVDEDGDGESVVVMRMKEGVRGARRRRG
ncbi:hypothetical protein C8A01DRAFT_12591, partial [Parachaetomium inaequale]